MADNAMVNLFLLALRDMQEDGLKEIGQPGSGKPDYLKYYALGAIHGEPREDVGLLFKPRCCLLLTARGGMATQTTTQHLLSGTATIQQTLSPHGTGFT